jgi:hypothetical protein
MMPDANVLVGSLRNDWLNYKTVHPEALNAAPMKFEMPEIGHLPRATRIPRRLSFQQQIKSADAVSLRHPECNHSVPGALENAQDVASRPLREERVGRQIGGR